MSESNATLREGEGIRPASGDAKAPFPQPGATNRTGAADGESPRVLGWLMLGLCLTPLVIALFLQPAARGMGTHEQMGFPQCSFLVRTGYPCVSCGMTTSFALAVRGRMWESWVNQPAGLVLAVGCAAGVLIGGWVGVTGASLAPLGRRLLSVWMLVAILAGLLAAWGYKIIMVTSGH